MFLTKTFRTLAPKATSSMASTPFLTVRASAFATLTNNIIPSTNPPSSPHPASPQTDSPLSKASLFLQSGHNFNGFSFGADKSISGEVVFTTSLVGYTESLTDPSYRGQILVFTQPLIGNYGVPANSKDVFGLSQYYESNGIHVSGVVVSDYAQRYSHWNAVMSLGEWCKQSGVPALTGVDTREIVKLLTTRGSTLGKIVMDGEFAQDVELSNPNDRNLVDEVSTKTTVVYNRGAQYKVALVDCGAKTNILRSLIQRNAEVHLLPWNTSLTPIAKDFDGIFLSNGPGDPAVLSTLSANLRSLLLSEQAQDLPIFGICMGNLVLGNAVGMKSYKLKFGNRGHNQPCIDLTSNRCVITSQNHGYALDDTVLTQHNGIPSLLNGWTKYFVNANDGSNEGIRHKTRPWRSVQFHPEAKGGPMDTAYLFDEFMKDVQIYQQKKHVKSTTIPAIDTSTHQNISLSL